MNIRAKNGRFSGGSRLSGKKDNGEGNSPRAGKALTAEKQSGGTD